MRRGYDSVKPADVSERVMKVTSTTRVISDQIPQPCDEETKESELTTNNAGASQADKSSNRGNHST